MLLVEGDAVGFCLGEARVCAVDERAADGDLGGQTNDDAGDVGRDEGTNCLVDISWVGGEERAEDEENLTRAMRRGVAVVRMVLVLSLHCK